MLERRESESGWGERSLVGEGKLGGVEGSQMYGGSGRDGGSDIDGVFKSDGGSFRG